RMGAVTAADRIVQVDSRAGRRSWMKTRKLNRREPEGPAGETDIEKLCRKLGPLECGRRTEDHHDQGASIADGSCHRIEAGVADEASLHPGGALVLFKKLVRRAQDALPSLDRRDAEVVLVLRKFMQDRPGEHR